MKNIALVAISAFSSLVFAPASAQTVYKAKMVNVQSLISRDADGFKSCGIRTIVASEANKGEVLDISLSIWGGTLTGMMKAGRYRIPEAASNNLTPKALTPAPTSFWVAKATDSSSLAPFKTLPSDDKGFTLGVSETGPTIRAIADIISGEAMQISVIHQNASVHPVVAFSQEMPLDERTALIACLNGLTQRKPSTEK